MFPNMDAEETGKAVLLMRAMQQFEQVHKPVVSDTAEETVICGECEEDYPCTRMVAVMQMQILGQLTATLSAKLDQLSGMSGLMGIIKGGL